jgi:Lipocalin-like domain
MSTRFLPLVVILSSAIFPLHAQEAGSNPFVGHWKLVAADKILPDGSRALDYGHEPHGMAIFTSDGYFMIEIFRDMRVKFAANDRAKGTAEEYKAASLNTSCSFGTYSVDPVTGQVTMKIDRSTFPNYDETTQVRAYELKGDILSWKVPARPDGSIPVTVLRRISAE